jgi:hypothetical protein
MLRLLLLLSVLFTAGSVSAQESGENELSATPFAVTADEKIQLLEKIRETLKWFYTLDVADRQRLPVKHFRAKISPLELMQAAALLKQKEQPDMSRMVREILPYLEPTLLECFEIQERLGVETLNSFQEEREILSGIENKTDSTTRIKDGATRFLKEALNPAEKIALYREPQTPAEMMKAVDVLATTGRPTVIRYYLRKFLDANAKPNEYAQIAESLGSRKLLQIANNKNFEPHGKEVIAKIIAEAKKFWQNDDVVAESLERWKNQENPQNDKPLHALWKGNNLSLAQLIEKLGEIQDENEIDRLLAVILSFSTNGREGLAAALNSNNPALLFNAAHGLAQSVHDNESFLLYPALFAPSPLSNEQRQQIAETPRSRPLNLPDPENAAHELLKRANDYFEKKRSLNADFDGYVRFWNWNEKEQKVKYIRMKLPAAYRFFACRYAEQAYRIMPEIREIQRLYLTTLFERTAYLNGLDTPLNQKNNFNTHSGKISDDAGELSGDADEPSGNNDKPSGDNDKPSGDNDKPSNDSDKPSNDSDKPSNDSDKPSGDADKLSGDADKPSGDADKLSGDADKPSGDADKPSNDADKLSDNAEKPKNLTTDFNQSSADVGETPMFHLNKIVAQIEPQPQKQRSLLEEVLQFAIRKEHYAAAQVAAQMLGRLNDQDVLQPAANGKPSPLIQAVMAKDRRVRFAALEAVMNLQPAAPYSGSGFVAETLVWFSRSDGQRILISAHPKLANAAKTAGFFISSGYRGELAQTCRTAMQCAAETPDTELIVVDRITSEPSVAELVQEIRNDPRTADIPVAVLSDNEIILESSPNFQNRPEMQKIDQLHPNAPFTVSLSQTYPYVVNEDAAKWVHNDLFTKTGIEHVPPAIRLEQARKSLGWIKTILEKNQNGRKIYHFEDLEDTVLRALRSGGRIEEGLELAAVVKSNAMQAAIGETAANALFPIELRQKAANAFKKSIDNFGILLRGQQVQRLYDRYNAGESEPKESQKLLESLIDLVEEKFNKKENNP